MSSPGAVSIAYSKKSDAHSWLTFVNPFCGRFGRGNSPTCTRQVTEGPEDPYRKMGPRCPARRFIRRNWRQKLIEGPGPGELLNGFGTRSSSRDRSRKRCMLVRSVWTGAGMPCEFQNYA